MTAKYIIAPVKIHFLADEIMFDIKENAPDSINNRYDSLNVFFSPDRSTLSIH